MPNLSAIMFYKASFTVSLNDSSQDLLWVIVRHIKSWQTKKYNYKGAHILTTDNRAWTALKSGSRIRSSDGGLVYIQSEYYTPEKNGIRFPDDPTLQNWSCRIIERQVPPPGFAARDWITEIGFQQSDPLSAAFSCVVSYSDRAGYIGPYQAIPPATTPKLIANITNDPTLHSFSGSDTLEKKIYELSPGDWPEFESKINSHGRMLPYIYISPRIIDHTTKETELLIDPQELLNCVFGNALVFFSRNPDFSSEMKYINPDYSCYGGAIRVYQPNARGAYQHRYLSPAEIEQYGAEAVIGYLRKAFTQNVDFYDNSFYRIENCQNDNSKLDRYIRLSQLHAKFAKEQSLSIQKHTQSLADKDKQLKEKDLDIESSLELAEEAQLRAKTAEGERDDLQVQLFSAQVQLDQLRSAADEIKTLRRSLNTRFQIRELPDSAISVIEYFISAFGDRLDFSEDAKKSAKSCSLPLNELWKVFYALATDMYDIF